MTKSNPAGGTTPAVENSQTAGTSQAGETSQTAGTAPAGAACVPVVAVVGPTAAGKTALAVSLAETFDAEVVSFDSMQIYKGMDIATAKPTAAEMDGVPHHLIGTVSPSEKYSVARFKEDADAAVDDIRTRGKNVILCGGTGLYLDALLNNINYLDSADNGSVRAALRKECGENGVGPLYERLKTIDPDYAAKVDANNASRVIRALEVYTLTGYTMSYQIANSRKTPSRYRPFLIGLTARDREVLYQRIERRVDRMLEKGLLDEARDCLGRSSDAASSGATAAQAIGIKEMAPYLAGQAPLAECVEKLKRDTRHYAKRQLTWFKKEPHVHWIYFDECGSPEQAAREAARLVRDADVFEQVKR